MLEQFENAWKSQRHEKRDTLHTEIQTLLSALERERKRSRIILTICLAYTMVSLVGSGFILAGRDVTVSEVWPLAAAQTLALVVLAYLVHTRFLRTHPEPTSVRAAAESALAETTSSIWTLRLIAIAIGGMLALLAVAVMSLSSSGKMDRKAVTSFATLCLIIVIVNAVILVRKWRSNLQPRRDRLRAIVRDLDAQ